MNNSKFKTIIIFHLISWIIVILLALIIQTKIDGFKNLTIIVYCLPIAIINMLVLIIYLIYELILIYKSNEKSKFLRQNTLMNIFTLYSIIYISRITLLIFEFLKFVNVDLIKN